MFACVLLMSNLALAVGLQIHVEARRHDSHVETTLLLLGRKSPVLLSDARGSFSNVIAAFQSFLLLLSLFGWLVPTVAVAIQH